MGTVWINFVISGGKLRGKINSWARGGQQIQIPWPRKWLRWSEALILAETTANAETFTSVKREAYFKSQMDFVVNVMFFNVQTNDH